MWNVNIMIKETVDKIDLLVIIKLEDTLENNRSLIDIYDSEI
jgi:hypothetical protein